MIKVLPLACLPRWGHRQRFYNVICNLWGNSGRAASHLENARVQHLALLLHCVRRILVLSQTMRVFCNNSRDKTVEEQRIQTAWGKEITHPTAVDWSSCTGVSTSSCSATLSKPEGTNTESVAWSISPMSILFCTGAHVCHRRNCFTFTSFQPLEAQIVICFSFWDARRNNSWSAFLCRCFGWAEYK